MQVKRATECERDSGQKAQKPALGAAVEVRWHVICHLVQLADHDITGRDLYMFLSQEDDPLDAFMAELSDVEKQSEAPAPDKKRKADVALDEEADNVADFMEVCQLCVPV